MLILYLLSTRVIVTNLDNVLRVMKQVDVDVLEEVRIAMLGVRIKLPETMMQLRLFDVVLYLLCLLHVCAIFSYHFPHPQIIPKLVQPHIKCIVPDFYSLDNLVIFDEIQ